MLARFPVQGRHLQVKFLPHSPGHRWHAQAAIHVAQLEDQPNLLWGLRLKVTRKHAAQGQATRTWRSWPALGKAALHSALAWLGLGVVSLTDEMKTVFNPAADQSTVECWPEDRAFAASSWAG
jgi:hypothetical protein